MRFNVAKPVKFSSEEKKKKKKKKTDLRLNTIVLELSKHPGFFMVIVDRHSQEMANGHS